MYVSTTAYPSYPSNASSTWSSVYGQTPYLNNITIPVDCPAGQEQLCVQRNTKYYLRIDAQEPIQYDLTAYYGSIPAVLSAGRPVTDVVGLQQCKYYRAYLAANTQVDGSAGRRLHRSDGGVR